MGERRKLGEILVEEGLIDNIQLQSALAHQKNWGMRLGTALIEMKFISEHDLASILEKQLGTRCVSIMTQQLSQEVIDAMEAEVAKNYSVFPLAVSDKELVIATSDPLDLKMLDELGFSLGKRIKPQLALESDIKKAIRVYYDRVADEDSATEMSEEPVVENIQMVFEEQDRVVEPIVEPVVEPAKTEKKVVTTKAVLDALLSVLEKKGILKKTEVFDEIKKKS